MVSIKTLIPSALVLLAGSANALGCYSNGQSFKNMHSAKNAQGGPDTTNEVKDDINTTCDIVAGKTFNRGDPPYTRCSTWEVHVGDAAYNSINWAIRLSDNGEDSLVMSYDKCVDALNRELGGCEHGSEQNNGGFWWRIDPQWGACGSDGVN
ncbi:hypothetical protein Q7P37_004987 [Cladosporium fusiforme]